MERKKEKLNFLQNVSEKYKNLEADKKKVVTGVAIAVVAIVVLTIIIAIICSLTSGNEEKIVGNLNNSGYTVKKGSKVYISTATLANLNGNKRGIYECSSDGKSKLIKEEQYAMSLNVSNGYLYYLAINSTQNSENYIAQIIKMKPNGEKRQVLVDGIETKNINKAAINISDGWVYYLNADSKIEKIKTNGQKRQQIADEEVEYFQISGKYIYYTTKDDEFKRMKKDGSAIEEIEKGIEKFQVVDNEVYYIARSNEHLVKLNLKEKNNHNETEVVAKKVKTFNIYKNTIYYATKEENDQALYKIQTNGKKEQKLDDLKTENNYICVVGNWVYYTDKVKDENNLSDYTIYKIKTNGKDKQTVNI